MIRKTIAGLTAAAAIAGSLALAAPAQASTIGDGNPYNFDIVKAAIAATNADDALAGLDSYTAFFPNDRAFEVLAKSQGVLAPDHQYGGTVDETSIVTGLVNKLGLPAIEQVLLYHVVPNAYLPGAEVLAGNRIKTLTMANNQVLKVYVVSKSAPFIVLGDQDGRFFNDYVVKSKINAIDDGKSTVVHGISDVLLPKF
jgi:uncharacterized surface protein with fasciclin (FAS1) repeats